MGRWDAKNMFVWNEIKKNGKPLLITVYLTGKDSIRYQPRPMAYPMMVSST